MRFLSTRGQTPPMGFTEAVATGLAPDGGLLVPESMPRLSQADLDAWSRLDYRDLTAAVFGCFATDLSPEVIRGCVERAYSGFSHPEVAHVRRLADHLHVLELFHGPTLAFKDFALCLLGEFYELQQARTGVPVNVLGATSGDTGAAAIHGLLGRKGANIFILYPNGGVSPLQERQMTCTGAPNVFPLSIDGSFDDAQKIVKDVFGDLPFRHRHNLSAVNSINLARILAQVVYYFYAWFRLDEKARARGVEFVVPTGNFGNVLAGWWAQQMGLPVAGFAVATNQNDILHRFFEEGVYEVGAVSKSLAPSMDIQIASNFERYLYYMLDGDTDRVRTLMADFRTTGRLAFPPEKERGMRATRTDDAAIIDRIRTIHAEYGYAVDPHTACGFTGLNPERTSVVLSTAHPAKFPDAMEHALGHIPTHPTLERLKALDPVTYRLPADEAAVKAFIAERLDRL